METLIGSDGNVMNALIVRDSELRELLSFQGVSDIEHDARLLAKGEESIAFVWRVYSNETNC